VEIQRQVLLGEEEFVNKLKEILEYKKPDKGDSPCPKVYRQTGP
jgi:hypothetical protein